MYSYAYVKELYFEILVDIHYNDELFVVEKFLLIQFLEQEQEQEEEVVVVVVVGKELH